MSELHNGTSDNKHKQTRISNELLEITFSFQIYSFQYAVTFLIQYMGCKESMMDSIYHSYKNNYIVKRTVEQFDW